jgi:DNA-binding transcriptional regulator YiaG
MKNAKKETRGQRIARELRELAEVVRSGVPLESRYTVHTVRRPAPPSEYDAQAVRRVRQSLGVSQAVFADLLGISVKLEQSWEQGFRQPSRMACRLLDEIRDQRQRWLAILSA